MTDTRALYDQITELLDKVSWCESPLERLQLLDYAYDVAVDRIQSDRERAAFESRLSVPIGDLSERTGIRLEDLRKWSNDYRGRTGDERRMAIASPPLIDWSDAVPIDTPTRR